MLIGIPKETKDNENRVAITPDGVALLTQQGHCVRLETEAGLGSGFTDAQYQKAGAELVPTRLAWAVELVVKVKEPLPAEYVYLNGQRVFTFFHLAGGAPVELTRVLQQKNVTAIAYETLEDAQGRLPILAPMSAVAGNMATLMGSFYLAKHQHGKGTQLGRVLGGRHGKVVVIGDGVVGQHAAQVACAMGAKVFVAGVDENHMRRVQAETLPDANFFLSTPDAIGRHLLDADLVVGAVLCRGANAPKVVTAAMVQAMEPGSVIVDVSIDQGGCIATSKPTTHSHPIFIEHGVVHYCVTNMPGAYPRTSTLALVEATLPYILRIAECNDASLLSDPSLAKAVNVHAGRIVCRAVAESLGEAVD